MGLHRRNIMASHVSKGLEVIGQSSHLGQSVEYQYEKKGEGSRLFLAEPVYLKVATGSAEAAGTNKSWLL